MPRYSHPHTIDNGAGERIVFLRQTPGARGDRLEVENVVGPGSGPPMHSHLLQEEALTVLHGRIGYQRPGEQAHFGEAGTTMTFRPGEAHKFWNAGTGELRCSGYIEPADNIEYFLTELYDATRRNGGRGPDMFDAAYLMTRYRTEFAMLEIPVVVQRLLFPVLVAIGRLLGKYKRYSDAPEPVRR